MVLGYHNACLALLLRMAQTRNGSIQVFNSGYFNAVRDSEIFATDPDIGIGMSTTAHLDTGLIFCRNRQPRGIKKVF